MLDFFSHNCRGYLSNKMDGDVLPIYKWIHHCLLNGSKVIYAVEPTPIAVIRKLLEMDDQVLRHLDNKSLQVIDPDSIDSDLYSVRCRSDDVLFDKWLSLANEVADGSKSSCILIIATPELLASESGIEPLLSTARRLERKCSDHIEIICCYGQGYFFGLNLGDAISLMLMNQRNIYRCGIPGLGATKSRIIDVISRGLDKSLGKGSGRLIMTTLRYLYQVDNDVLLADPYELETRLRKLIGDMADYSFGYIRTEIKNELILNQQYLITAASASILPI